MLVFNPDPLDFDSVAVGDTLTLTLFVRNDGASSLDIDSVHFSLTPEFDVVPLDSIGILAGDSAGFDVRFTPFSDSSYSDSLFFVTSFGDSTGVNMIGVSTAPKIALNPIVLNFDTVAIGVTDSFTVIVNNIGTDSLYVTNIFTTNGACTVSAASLPLIAPADSDSVAVIFTPTIAATFQDTVFFDNSDPGLPQAFVELLALGRSTTSIATVSGNWSTPATWGGIVPFAGDSIIINTGVSVTFDGGANDALQYGDFEFIGSGSALVVATDGVGSTGLKLGNVSVNGTTDTLSVLSSVTLTVDTINIPAATELEIHGDGVLNHNPVFVTGTLGLGGLPVALDTVIFNGAGANLNVNSNLDTIRTIDFQSNATLTFGVANDTLVVDSMTVGTSTLTIGATAGTILNTKPLNMINGGHITINANLTVNTIVNTGFTNFNLSVNTLSTDSIFTIADDLTINGSGSHSGGPIVYSGGVLLLTGNITVGDISLAGKTSINLNGLTLTTDTIDVGTDTLEFVSGGGILSNNFPIKIGPAPGTVLFTVGVVQTGDIDITGNGGRIDLGADATTGFIDVLAGGDIDVNAQTLTADSIYVTSDTLKFSFSTGTINNTGPIRINPGTVTTIGGAGASTEAVNDIVLNGGEIVVNRDLTLGDLIVPVDGSITVGPGDSFIFASTGLFNTGAVAPVTLTWTDLGGSVNFNGGSTIQLEHDLSFTGAPNLLNFGGLAEISSSGGFPAVFDAGTDVNFASGTVLGGFPLTLQGVTPRKYTLSNPATPGGGNLIIAGGDTLELTVPNAFTITVAETLSIVDSAVFIAPPGTFVNNGGTFINTSSSAPMLAFNPDPLDFDSVAVGDTLSLTLFVRNDGVSSLDIDSVHFTVTPEFDVVPLDSIGILAGDSAGFNVSFTPFADSAYSDSLFFVTSFGDSIGVNMIGVGTAPLIAVNPIVLNFDTVAVGDSSLSFTVIVNNNGTDTLDVFNIFTTNADFTVSAASLPLIAPADSDSVSVVFIPTIESAAGDTLFFDNNDPGLPQAFVELQGVGIPPSTSIANVTGNWSSAATWSGGFIPGPGTDVIISNAATVTFDGAALDTLYGTLTFESGLLLSVTTSGTGSSGIQFTEVLADTGFLSITVASGQPFSADSVTIGNNGIFTLSGDGNYSLGPVNIAGNLHLAGAPPTIDSVRIVGDNSRLSMNVTGNSTITVNKITMLDSLDLDISNTDTLQTDSIVVGSHALTIVGLGKLNNLAPISVGNGGELRFTNSSIVGDVDMQDNSSVIVVNQSVTAGVVDLSGVANRTINVTAAGVFTTDSINTNAATLVLTGTGSINNAVPINMGAGSTLELATNHTVNDISLSGKTQFDLGTFSLTTDTIDVGTDTLEFFNNTGTVTNNFPIKIGANPGTVLFNIAGVTTGDIVVTGAGGVISAAQDATVGNVEHLNADFSLNMLAGITLNTDTIFVGRNTLSVSGGTTGIINSTAPIQVDTLGGISLDAVTVGDIDIIGDSSRISLVANSTAGFIDLFAKLDINPQGFTFFLDSIAVNSDTLQIAGPGVLSNTFPIDIGAGGVLWNNSSGISTNTIEISGAGGILDVDSILNMSNPLNFLADGTVKIAPNTVLDLGGNGITNSPAVSPVTITFA